MGGRVPSRSEKLFDLSSRFSRVIALAKVEGDLMKSIGVNDGEVAYRRSRIETSIVGGMSELYTKTEFVQCLLLKMSTGPSLHVLIRGLDDAE